MARPFSSWVAVQVPIYRIGGPFVWRAWSCGNLSQTLRLRCDEI